VLTGGLLGRSAVSTMTSRSSDRRQGQVRVLKKDIAD
jgi:hypothetical protein